VVESQTDLVCRYLEDTTLSFVNDAYCRCFNRTRQELIGVKFLELIPAAARDKVLNSIAILSREPRVITHEHEVTLPDGTIGWQQWTNYPIFGSDGKPAEFQAIGHDITDRKRSEEANRNLAHASRLAIVGELTAMIAHEINQPLGAIQNNADAAELLLESNSPPLGEVRQILTEIRKDNERATEAIYRIRALLRKRDMDMRPLVLNDVISEALQFVTGDALLRRVEIHSELAAKLPVVRADRVQLQQVLLNLLLNAMEAVAELPLKKRQVLVRTDSDGEGAVVVTVADSGPGVPADKLPLVFESFFTTKRGGMGLGLSIAKSIIENHKGRIWVENGPCGGAVFRFKVPAIQGRGNSD
jgi:PAS domain S-box-containing protein